MHYCKNENKIDNKWWAKWWRFIHCKWYSY